MFTMPIKTSEIIHWTRQLAALLNAHLPLVQALNLLSNAQQNKKLQQLTLLIQQEISAGNSLSIILKQYPKLFDKTYCQLIYSAEQSGMLSQVLQKIVQSQMLKQQLQNQLIKLFIYPCIVLITGLSLFIFLLVWVVPQLAQIFQHSKQELPWFTQLILNTTYFVQQYGLYIFLAFIIIGMVTYLANNYHHKSKICLAKILWVFPFINKLTQQTTCILFSRTLTMLLSAGIPIATGLPMTIDTLKNVYAQQNLRIAVLLIYQGHSFSYALAETKLFPKIALQMCQIGEHTGKLDSLLDDCALYYQQQLDVFIQNIMQLIEPFLFIILGLLIGSVVIAMYLPLFELGLVLGK